MKLLNQYSSRTVPAVVGVSGTATNTATVTVNFEPTERKGDYWWGEAPAENAWGPLWLGITNIAVLDDAPNADIIATNFGHVYVPQSPETFTYDDDGNLTGDGRWSYAWDGENRATSFTRVSSAPDDGKVKLDCQYDAQWRRIEKVVSTWTGSTYAPESTNRFVYDGWNLMAIVDETSTVVQSFTWSSDASGSLQGAGGVGGLISMTVHSGANTGTYFYCYDGNHNVRALVDASDGTVVAEYDYSPFGQLIRATGPLALENPFLFSTKFCDWETGLYYYGYRYYDADTGSWFSRDPIAERGGANLYGLVDNNPVDHFDALGLQAARVPVPPAPSSASSSQSACDDFDNWYQQEKADLAYSPNWLSTLPDCPCNLTMSCRSKHQSPKAKEQDSSPVPKPIKGWRFDELVVYHPGARWCIRSKPSVSRSSQQCCYDGSGKLITHGLGAGTPDRRARGYGHGGADADPFTDALKCDGGIAGESVGKYLEVRPPNKGNGCDQNPP